jgi:6-phosphogluconate dehydrogenase
MKQRAGHFMSPEMLQSQFDIYEPPVSGRSFDVNQEFDKIMIEIINYIKKSSLGIMGMGVMGVSLARNIAGKGYRLSLYNRHLAGKEEGLAQKAISQYNELSDCPGFDDLPTFIQSLETPRKIWLMVQAGDAVDELLDVLAPQLTPGDILIDGGNSQYEDTVRRQRTLEKIGIHLLGTGVSGGELGALHGPAIMVGGSQQAYREVQQIFERIAARNKKGEVCCARMGEGGAGHFVKMVHNGIEYGEMQIIADLVSHLRYDQGRTLEEISRLFDQWNLGISASYLLEITVQILRVKDVDGEPLVDKILDVAESKGTGTWASIAASQLGVGASVMTEALYARFLSAEKSSRQLYASVYGCLPVSGITRLIPEDDLEHLYLFCRIINHHQGMMLIRQASEKYGWNTDPAEVLKVWTGGCIIRSVLLEKLLEGVTEHGYDVLLYPFSQKYIQEHYSSLMRTLSALSESNLAFPVFHAAMDYFKAMITGIGNAGIIQAQRDCFGAHTYRRLDDSSDKSYHTVWIPENT